MFNLIVAVLSIALIGITAGASVYYGGTAFSNSNNRGQVSALISAGGQIAAAQSLHRTEKGGVGAKTVQQLISDRYLQAQPSVPTGLPSAGEWSIADDGAMALLLIGDASDPESAADLVCKKAVEEGGARLVAGPAPTGGNGEIYPDASLLTPPADNGTVLGTATVDATLDLADDVKLAGYNDGRRVNFGCLQWENETYFGYRI
jgi:hypothetical protein